MQAAHPGDSSLARAAEALAEREFEVVAHTDGPLDAAALADAVRARHRPPLGPEVGGHRQRRLAAARAGRDRRDRVLRPRRRRPDRPRRDRGGQVRRQPQRAPRPVRPRDRQRHAPGLRPPSPRRAVMGARGARARRRPADADVLAGVDAACFYRAGALAAANGARVIARAHQSASIPGAPLAAVAEHGAGRVVVTADSDLFGDDCIGELDHERAVAEPRRLGRAARRSPTRPSAAASPATADPAWTRLRDAVEELRLTQARRRLGRHRRARPATPARAGRRRSPSRRRR